MRGIGHTLSRLPAVRALLAGAAILAGTSGPAAFAQGGGGDQTAMAIPRIGAAEGGSGSPASGGYAAFPRPLSPSDAARIRRIFADQAAGRMTAAAALTGALEHKLLLGTILADRYLGPYHRSTPTELTAWLATYPGQPDAPAIQALLARRLPRGMARPAVLDASPPACLAPARLTDPVPAEIDPGATSVPRNPLLDREIAARLERGAFDAAENLLTHTPGLTPAYAALLRAEVARALFAANRDGEALRVAAAARRAAAPNHDPGPPAYIAGLASWRLGQMRDAAYFFAAAARAPGAADSLRAAGAYWAARVARRRGQTAQAGRWLRRAAAEKQTFYGLIARRRLGWSIGLMFAHATLSEADLAALDAIPRGRRAFALLQVGQTARAEQELRCLWPAVENDPALRQAVLLVAARAGLSQLATQLAGLIQTAQGIPAEDLSFPVPPLHPLGGFRVDPSLVYGVTRAESNFDPSAVSPAGARGLMQITRATARSLTGNQDLRGASLHDPGFNLELGQRLVRYLASRPAIDGDLIGMLASYNAGFGSYLSWHDKVRDEGDPLLFLEAIPIRETRLFVQRALAYTWLYAARLGLPAPSLGEIADGQFPRYAPQPAGATVLVSLH